MAATKLDSSKDIYRGELFVFAKPDDSGESDVLPLAFATTATLEITTEEVDISNKMMGGWAGSLPGKKSYTVSSEALVTRKEGALSYDTLLKAQIDGKVLDFFFGEAAVADQDNNGGTFTPDKTKKNYTGRIMITSQSLTSEAGQIAKLSVSFKGIGALEQVEGTTGG
mgnify:FL=1|jgi:TP901-1 family phage major tail protein